MSIWQKIRGNKYFVAVSSAVMTYLITAAYNWATAGTPALTIAQLKTTALAAVAIAIGSIYHLYTQPSSTAAVKN